MIQHSVDSILGQSAAADSSSYSDLTHPPRHRQRRSRTAFTDSAISRLEDAFDAQPYPDIGAREALADEVGVSEARIQVWFQNRRSRLRRRQGIAKKRPEKNSSDSRSSSPIDQSLLSTHPKSPASSTPIRAPKLRHKTPHVSPITTHTTPESLFTPRSLQYPAYPTLGPYAALPYYASMFADVQPAMPYSTHWSPVLSPHYMFQLPTLMTSPLSGSGSNEGHMSSALDLRTNHSWITSPDSHVSGHVSPNGGSLSPPAHFAHRGSSGSNEEPEVEILDVVS